MVTAEYSGTVDFTYVYQASDPSINQQHGHFQWDEQVTVRLNRANGVVVGKPKLEISGQIVSTWAPPNTAFSCTGNFSPRTGIPAENIPDSASMSSGTPLTMTRPSLH